MDPRHLSRLQEEQRKAISQTDVKIEQIKQFKQDYKVLQDRLETLPDKITHDVMVPLGKLAFMPGQLVHTNEILVLLGDNWFVERSAKQAVEIACRRIKELDQKLTDMKAQQKLLEPRLGFTSEMQSEIQGHGEVKEIVEEYEEAKERLWDEQHRKNVKKYKQEARRNLQSQDHQQPKEEDKQKTDSSLWSRFDELERQETERGEMDSVSSVENEENENSQSNVPSDVADRRVNWADERDENNSAEKSGDDSDDDYTEEDETDNEEDEADNEEDNEEAAATRRPAQRTITFTHSPTPSVLPHHVQESDDLAIQSPADIYRHFSPKSILKRTSETSSFPDSKEETNLNPSKWQGKQNTATTPGGEIFSSTSDMENKSQPLYQSRSSQQLSSSSAHKAFTGCVVEKSTDVSTTASFATETPSTSVNVMSTRIAPKSTSDEPPKRVSKFKASRLH